jgi:hypothetical protein
MMCGARNNGAPCGGAEGGQSDAEARVGDDRGGATVSGQAAVYPRNARSLAAWIPVADGDVVGMVGSHPPLRKSLVNAGAIVVRLPRVPPADLTEPLAHLVVPAAGPRDPWLAPGAVTATVRAGGTVLVGVRHRSIALRRGALSAAQFERALAEAGVADSRVLGASHGMYNLRALVPLDAALMRWYAQQAFLPRSHRGALGIRALCSLGRWAPLRAMFPVLVGIGTVRVPA